LAFLCIQFTVWARPDLITAAEFALDLGKTIINFFEDYFELAYPLEKTDMLAVPHFAAGAMENWGLLIFREATLIWDPVSGIENAKQKVASVISHEIAHQDEAFAVQHVQKVLYVDSMSTTRPVFLPVSHPDEINESFDTISYSKVSTDLIRYIYF
uniref:Peptidase_M1 domain-containing protein n=1 Tax=Hymenolepis diminuta TaxID=6216 RepID=A0A0R3SJK8_HYMDI